MKTQSSGWINFDEFDLEEEEEDTGEEVDRRRYYKTKSKKPQRTARALRRKRNVI